jgi:hypothetical protein
MPSTPPTTVGQVLVNQMLPPDMRRDRLLLDKKGIVQLFREVADKHPDQYRDVAQGMMNLGHFAAQAAGTSLSLNDLLPTPEVEVKLKILKSRVDALGQSELPDDQKEAQIQQLVRDAIPEIDKGLYEGGVKRGNNLALQVKSGSRGKVENLRQLIAGDMLVVDHRDRVIPVPILRGYAQGTDPVEYWAGSYGARKGTVSTKFATQDAGFLGKQLAMVAHRLTVGEKDCGTAGGLPVHAADGDNVGSVLAAPAGDLPAGHALAAADLKKLGDRRILVRSPVTCQAQNGVCAVCAGKREKGRYPDVGDNIGMAAAQAIGEPLSQGMLSAKHSGGAVGAHAPKTTGFDYINQLIQVPKTFRDAAVVAKTAGRVNEVTPAPQGGHYIKIGEHEHYAGPDVDVQVKTGDRVDAGDVLSGGTPNPAEIVAHKGIGEGRRHFVETFGRALKNSGVAAHRRNLELLARGLINHVRVTDIDGVTDAMPDDLVHYDTLSRQYRPRPDARAVPPQRAVGMYLEKPVLHYSIGTKVTDRMADEMKQFEVPNVLAHDREPPFHPEMLRGMEQGTKDPNWVTRLGGSYLEKGLLEATHRGRTSQTHDTSYMPSLTQPADFGKPLTGTGKY